MHLILRRVHYTFHTKSSTMASHCANCQSHVDQLSGLHWVYKLQSTIHKRAYCALIFSDYLAIKLTFNACWLWSVLFVCFSCNTKRTQWGQKFAALKHWSVESTEYLAVTVSVTPGSLDSINMGIIGFANRGYLYCMLRAKCFNFQ